MKNLSIVVKAQWDAESSVWVASSSDIQGLAVEAPTQEDLRVQVVLALEDLLELNGFESDLSEIPVHIVSDSLSRVSNPCAA